jgi:sugar phosphate isomerase/epimerase
LAVATYPFRALITASRAGGKGADTPNQDSQTQMTLAQFGETVVDRFNVPGIEPWSHHFESVEPDYVRDLSRSFRKSGLRVVNIPCDVRAQLCGTPEERVATLETYRKWVDAAVILGSPSIRVHVPRTATPDDLSCAVDGLKALAAYGAQKDIVINLENDNPDTEDPFQIVKIIEAANTPYLRALPDFCNSRQLGDEQYNERALRALFPHAFNISHVKDMEVIRGNVLRTDVDKIFSIATEAGYRGYFSMEWEAAGGDPYDGTRKLIAASLKNLGAQ